MASSPFSIIVKPSRGLLEFLDDIDFETLDMGKFSVAVATTKAQSSTCPRFDVSMDGSYYINWGATGGAPTILDTARKAKQLQELVRLLTIVNGIDPI